MGVSDTGRKSFSNLCGFEPHPNDSLGQWQVEDVSENLGLLVQRMVQAHTPEGYQGIMCIMCIMCNALCALTLLRAAATSEMETLKGWSSGSRAALRAGVSLSSKEAQKLLSSLEREVSMVGGGGGVVSTLLESGILRMTCHMHLGSALYLSCSSISSLCFSLAFLMPFFSWSWISCRPPHLQQIYFFDRAIFFSVPKPFTLRLEAQTRKSSYAPVAQVKSAHYLNKNPQDEYTLMFTCNATALRDITGYLYFQICRPKQIL